MIKGLFFIILFFFLIFRVGGFIMRVLFGGLQKHREEPSGGFQRNRPSTQHRNSTTGNSNKKGYQGGEYIDYEEVE